MVVCEFCGTVSAWSMHPVVLQCGHAVAFCCFVRLHGRTGNLDCPFCTDPRSVFDADFAFADRGSRDAPAEEAVTDSRAAAPG